MTTSEIAKNSTVIINGHELQVGEYIANGAAANVFRGQYEGRPVAVKAMRGAARASFHSEFKAEAATLRRLAMAWKRCGYGEPGVVPELFESDVDSDFPCLVEEFANGQPLNVAMQGLDEGVFSEQQALSLARQIGRVLEILHEELQHCYGDVKFGNFLVVGDPRAAEPGLKMIDWNVLGAVTESNIRVDLIKVSAYVLYMLTGEMVDVYEDTQQASKQPAAVAGFEKLTAGTRHFLEQAFHPVLESRFASMRAWLDEVEKLVGWWCGDPRALVEEAKGDRAKGQRGTVGDYLTALAKLEISARRGVPEAASLARDVGEEISGDRVVDRMLSALWGAQHDRDACEREFTDAARRPQYRLNLRVMLWGWVARAAAQMGSYWHHQDELRASTEARLEGKFEAAVNGYRELAGTFPDNQALRELGAEAEALMVVEQAAAAKPVDEAGFQGVCDQYARALNLSGQVPEGLRDVAIAGRQIEQQHTLAEKRTADFREAERLLNEGLCTTDVTEASTKLEKALDLTPVPSEMLRELKRAVVATLDAGSYDTAARIARIPARHGHKDAWFTRAIAAAARLVMLHGECLQLKDARAGLDRVLAYVRDPQMGELEPELAYPLGLAKLLVDRVKHCGVDNLSGAELDELGKPLQALSGEKLARDETLRSDVASILEAKTRGAAERIQREEQRAERGRRMDEAWQRLETWKQMEVEAGDDALPIVVKARKRYLLSLVELYCGAVRDDSRWDQLRIWRERLDQLGFQRWVEVQAFLNRQTQADKAWNHEVFAEFLENGQLDEAKLVLQLMAPSDEASAMAVRVEKVANFQAWAGAATPDWKQAARWAKERGVPHWYWEQGALKWLDERREALLQGRSTGQLEELVTCAWVAQRVREEAGAAPATTWADVRQAADAWRKAKTGANAKQRAELLGAIARLASPEKPQHEQRGDRGNRWLLWVGGTAFVVMVLVVGLLGVSAWLHARGAGGVKATPTLVSQATAAAAENPGGKTSKDETPTPTNTPQANPPDSSKFVWPADGSVKVSLPAGVQPMYLLDDGKGLTVGPDPATWQSQNGGANGKLQYANNLTKPATIDWTMDAGVAQDGLYAFYAYDPKRGSAANQALTYQLFVNGEQAARKPDFGIASAYLMFSTYQADDEWRGVGMYFLKAGDKVRVHVDVPQLVADEMVGADALAIALVPNVTHGMSQLMNLAKGAVYWADDAQATRLPADGWTDFSNDFVWLGGHQIDLAQVKDKKVSVVWVLPDRLIPGTYRVKVFVPDECKVNATIAAFTSTNPGMSDPKMVLGPLESKVESGVRGAAFDAGTFTVSPMLDKDKHMTSNGLPFLMVNMTAEGAEGVFAYDDVLVFLEPAQ